MFEHHKSHQRMYQEGELTLGLHVPLENFKSRTPKLEKQVELAKKADQYGFTALWLRDVLLKDPYFMDPAVGQIYDMLIYGTHLLGQTRDIALGTSALVLPLRHPLRSAKEVATIEALFPERLILGISSGDRQADFHGLGIDHPSRGEQFKESLRVMESALYENYPHIESPYGDVEGATLVPRPKTRIPTMITGFAQQDMDWIARNGDGWMYYPQAPQAQANAVAHWRSASVEAGTKRFRPFSMPMHLDLSKDPDELPTPIRLGFRVGRNRLIELLKVYRSIGVNHLFFALFDSERPAEEVIDELGTYVLPHFPPHHA
ncbi:LLM class oxidoreductase [Exiguobacterium flavidum]|uniref:LLM class oxidoreductase n=1 Tax=Exiguobacterium flavidum TaxID=2184695 RepID=UPI000DF7F19D|nr:LLM class oxidoreductase [Exiguobacterium flavidum]